MTHHLQKVKFKNQFGDYVFFDENGDPPASYDLINWQLIDGKVKHVTLGHFAMADNGDYDLSIDEEKIVWRTGKMASCTFLFSCAKSTCTLNIHTVKVQNCVCGGAEAAGLP